VRIGAVDGGHALASFVLRWSTEEELTARRTSYGHMGATLGDAVLQAGLNYETVVRPRVRQIMSDFPEATTASAFLDVIRRVGPETVLRWNHAEKPRRLSALVTLLAETGVETEPILAQWLSSSENRSRIMSIPGIGPKTVDYLAILAGAESVAVDRHILRVVELVSGQHVTYQQASQMVVSASVLLNCSPSTLDGVLWSLLSRSRECEKSGNREQRLLPELAASLYPDDQDFVDVDTE
jgi:3-methyladenine DNA glycosylase/8-oxoguanine DNA glycosylase